MRAVPSSRMRNDPSSVIRYMFKSNEPDTELVDSDTVTEPATDLAVVIDPATEPLVVTFIVRKFPFEHTAQQHQDWLPVQRRPSRLSSVLALLFQDHWQQIMFRPKCQLTLL